AIGTGETATPEQAQAMHAFVRARLIERFGESAARALPILYGGSMNEHNAADLLVQSDVDGGLVGGASLKAESFAQIVTAAGQAKGWERGGREEGRL
ncbi:MAG TPA: triose-phosphate isomerase, partial [Rhodothermales bacterium]|nr:triose-phosphate isomerase [Rhodothermales bacterium]